MAKLLQIDVCLNWGSTGKIAEGIAKVAIDRGWNCYMIHGSRYNRPGTLMNEFQPGSKLDEYLHYAEHYFLDNDGLASRGTTRRAVEYIKKLKPDLIQIHTIHDHWLNYRILFEYLNTLDIPIVWTQHDCWCFTGDCGHFSQFACSQWAIACTEKCPFRNGQPWRKLLNNTAKHYRLKKELFTIIKNLTLVPVSYWLEGVIRNSFLKEKPIKTILNGVDTDVFHPCQDKEVLKKYGLENTPYVIAAATAWSKRKGLEDYVKLAGLSGKRYKIVLVGLQGKQADIVLRKGIIAIPRTDNQRELAVLYSSSQVVLNLSYEESFGLTSAEGFSCGRPTVVYNSTASPELVGDSLCGRVLGGGDVAGVAAAIEELMQENQDVLSVLCRERALKFYDKNKRFADYVNLYESLI